MPIKNWPFTFPGNYTVSDAAKIEVANDVAKLIVTASSEIFYNSFDSEGVGGAIDPGDCETPSGLAYCEVKGAERNISDPKFGDASLKLSGGVSVRVAYRNTAGASFWPGVNSNKGTISFWLRPSWTDNPGPTQHMFFVTYSATCGIRTMENRVAIYHLSTEELYAGIWDSSGTLIASMSNAWSPVGSTWYHIEFGWDVDAGNTYLFADGILVAYTTGTTGSRLEATYPTNQVYIGQAGSGGKLKLIDDFFMLDTVLHTANFTPPILAGPPSYYPSDKPWVQPAVSFDPIILTNWTALVEVSIGAGSVGYNLSINDGVDWLYWGGSSWDSTPGDGSDYNDIATITANIDTLDVSPDIILSRIFLISDGTQQINLDNLELTFTPLDVNNIDTIPIMNAFKQTHVLSSEATFPDCMGGRHPFVYPYVGYIGHTL